jgi:endonuclease/exonuclease/phosphatase (EEP) superfamily protein YafD
MTQLIETAASALNLATTSISPTASRTQDLEKPAPPVQRQWIVGRGLWWGSYLTAWGATIFLLVIAALRVFYHDGAFPLIWLNAFTTYVYLPAYAALAWAAWYRRWLLALANVAVVSCHVAWLAPDFLRDRRFDVLATPAASTKKATTSPTVRIFFANVAENNTEYDAMLGEIAGANPDVIVLVEYGWGWHRAFKTAPAMKPYVYGSGHLQSHIGSVNVFSRLPLKTELQNWVDGRALHTIDIEIGAATLRVLGLHAPRPIDGPRYNYRGYWQQMLPLLTAERVPLVVVGDFNATQHSAVHEQLIRGGLQSAHEAVSRGYATTWPNGLYWLPPIRIDHAFVSAEVECVSIAEGQGRGSDHRPLILDVRVRNPAPASRAVGESVAAGN